MKTPNFEQIETLKENGVERFGRGVTLEVDLIRHSEKDYATGNLMTEGKQALVAKLRNEYASSEKAFDTVKCYVSPLKRGQQAREPLSQLLREIGVPTTIRTKQELLGQMDRYSDATDKALDWILQARGLSDAGELNKTDALEPVSKDEESLKNEILLEEFFDKEFPESDLKGTDVALEQDALIRHFAEMATRLYSGSRVKLIIVGHSGIIEYLTKLIYIKNHPDVKSEDVSMDMIGGLIDYMSGPRITITSDATGKQSAMFRFKELSLEYALGEL